MGPQPLFHETTVTVSAARHRNGSVECGVTAAGEATDA
jgi:hypothetical protein